MNFLSDLPLIPSKKDSIWVIIDRLTKSSHFLHLRTDYLLQKLARLYIAKIVRLYGIPMSIISNRDSCFMSHFWKSLHEALNGHKCRTPLCLTNLGEKKVLGLDLVQEIESNVKIICDRLKVASD